MYNRIDIDYKILHLLKQTQENRKAFFDASVKGIWEKYITPIINSTNFREYESDSFDDGLSGPISYDDFSPTWTAGAIAQKNKKRIDINSYNADLKSVAKSLDTHYFKNLKRDFDFEGVLHNYDQSELVLDQNKDFIFLHLHTIPVNAMMMLNMNSELVEIQREIKKMEISDNEIKQLEFKILEIQYQKEIKEYEHISNYKKKPGSTFSVGGMLKKHSLYFVSPALLLNDDSLSEKESWYLKHVFGKGLVLYGFPTDFDMDNIIHLPKDKKEDLKFLRDKAKIEIPFSTYTNTFTNKLNNSLKQFIEEYQDFVHVGTTGLHLNNSFQYNGTNDWANPFMTDDWMDSLDDLYWSFYPEHFTDYCRYIVLYHRFMSNIFMSYDDEPFGFTKYYAIRPNDSLIFIDDVQEHKDQLALICSFPEYLNARKMSHGFILQALRQLGICEYGLKVESMMADGFYRIWLRDADGVGQTEENILSWENAQYRNLLNEGSGVRNIVLLIMKIAACAMRIGKEKASKTTLILEEPEAHLHPNYQSMLADIILLSYETFRFKFIVETHSEYLLRKLQLYIAKKRINKSQLSINYCYDKRYINENNDRIIKQIPVAQDGSLLEDFGTGFYDEALNLKFDLLQIRNQN